MSHFTNKLTETFVISRTRTSASRQSRQQVGIKVKEVLWLQGEYDFIAILETSDDLVATASNLNTAKQGNVHTTTIRAFTEA
jgi:uncharacterized protein with GYD domain